MLQENHVIKDEDAACCRYGLELFLSSCGEIAAILVLSVFTRNFLQTACFFLAFVPLRIFAGGYHADTRLRCFGILVAAFAALTLMLCFLPAVWYTPVITGAVLFTAVMVLAFAPVHHANKGYGESERRQYRRTSILICAVQSAAVIAALLLIHEASQWLLAFSMGQLAVSLSMGAANIKAFIKGKELNEDEKVSEQC